MKKLLRKINRTAAAALIITIIASLLCTNALADEQSEGESVQEETSLETDEAEGESEEELVPESTEKESEDLYEEESEATSGTEEETDGDEEDETSDGADETAPVFEEFSCVYNGIWTNTDVIVTGKIRDEGGEISCIYFEAEDGSKTDITDLLEEDGIFEYTFTGDQDASYVFYAADSRGNISDGEQISVMIDTRPPCVSDYGFTVTKKEGSVLESVLNILTFGIFFRGSLEIRITAEDDGQGSAYSGVIYITLYIETEDEQGMTDAVTQTALADPLTGEAEFYIDEEYLNAKIYARAEDGAGNISDEAYPDEYSEEIKSSTLITENLAPCITIDPDTESAAYESEDGLWFTEDISFEVGVCEQLFLQEDEASYSGIADITVTVNGQEIICEEFCEEGLKVKSRSYYSLSTAGIEANEDGSYVICVLARDNCANEACESLTVYKDSTAPMIGDISFYSLSGESIDPESEDGGYYFSGAVSVAITASDEGASCGIAEIFYLVLDENEEEVLSGCDTADENGTVSFTLAPDLKVYIYAFASDNAGNTTGVYASETGLVLESEKLHESVSSITFEYEKKEIYSSGVSVSVTVSDTYSGIKGIEWSVVSSDTGSDRKGTISGWETETNDNSVITSAKRVITVSADADDIVLSVRLTDNAGNVSSEQITLSIDRSAPEVSVSYDNNSVYSGNFFNSQRIAKITITERNFDPECAAVTVKKDGAAFDLSSLLWVCSGYSEVQSVWCAYITFSADGDYTLDISCTDKAGNKSSGVSAGSSAAPFSFTIDKTAPEIIVSYDNNSVSGGSYFSSARTATVTVTEHNFDAESVSVNISSFLNGQEAEAPSLGAWYSNGSAHTAVIVFSQDADYTLEISCEDKANNTAADVKAASGTKCAFAFTIDTTLYSAGLISGVEDEAAYTGDVVPVIYFEDINYARGSVSITLSRTSRESTDTWTLEDELLSGCLYEWEEGAKACLDIFEYSKGFDGIYTLSAEYTDLAGNRAKEEMIFTVNRFGSVFTYSEDLIALVQEVYVQGVDEKELVITEYNPSALTRGSSVISISINGAKVSEAVYEVSEEEGGAEDGWYKYEYTLSAENFTGEGIYKITVMTEDEAGNTSLNTLSDDFGGLVFCVDTTAPEIINITGLEEKIINAVSCDVTYSIYDAASLLSLEVWIGGELKESVSFEAGQTDYSGSFTVPEGTGQSVRLIVTDMAGNITDTASEGFKDSAAYEFNDVITVSSSPFIRWYSDKLFFWGSILSAVLALAAAVLICALKRKKKRSVL